MIQYIIYRETRFVETSFLMYKILTKPFLLVQTRTTCPYNLEVNRRHTPLTLGKDHFTADLHFGFSRLGNFIQNNKKNFLFDSFQEASKLSITGSWDKKRKLAI